MLSKQIFLTFSEHKMNFIVHRLTSNLVSKSSEIQSNSIKYKGNILDLLQHKWSGSLALCSSSFCCLEATTVSIMNKREQSVQDFCLCSTDSRTKVNLAFKDPVLYRVSLLFAEIQRHEFWKVIKIYQNCSSTRMKPVTPALDMFFLFLIHERCRQMS